MNWFDIELEIPIYAKHFEIVEAPDEPTAREIALRKTELNYNLSKNKIFIIKIKKINY